MRSLTAALAAMIIALASGGASLAQSSQSSNPSPSISVPRLISVSGVFRPADRQPPNRVEAVTLAIYADESGGTPLWQETQSINLDRSGTYTLLLGASELDGVPLDVFASGEARWLAIVWQRPGEVEGPRTRLTSVPYALHAMHADTLGGKPASAYMLAPTAGGKATSESTTTTAAVAEPAAVNPGTTNFLAKYVTAANVDDSAVYETAGKVGINTTNPFDVLHSRFSNTNGTLTGLAVQNLGNTDTSFSGMLFYDQFGALAQFQGFNNVTHEYRINNVASNASINFMLGGTSRFLVAPTGDIGIGFALPLATLDVNGTVLAETAGEIAVTGWNLNLDGLGTGVYGEGDGSNSGVEGFSDTGYGVLGTSSVVGVRGVATDPAGWAGYFDGDLETTGTLYKAAGAFRIDHPLDPENRYLSHSFVESPDMKNIYDGVVVLDDAGEATVTLPDWFEALNRDFRYQLTPIGASFVPYIAQEIAGNQFRIAGGLPGKKVSWQVTGIRHDAFANAHRIQVEQIKKGAAVGTYLHPEAFGQPGERAQSLSTKQDQRAHRLQALKDKRRANRQKP